MALWVHVQGLAIQIRMLIGLITWNAFSWTVLQSDNIYFHYQVRNLLRQNVPKSLFLHDAYTAGEPSLCRFLHKLVAFYTRDEKINDTFLTNKLGKSKLVFKLKQSKTQIAGDRCCLFNNVWNSLSFPVLRFAIWSRLMSCLLVFSHGVGATGEVTKCTLAQKLM